MQFTDNIDIVRHPQKSIIVAVGGKFSLSITVEGPGKDDFVYQWKKKNDDLLPGRIAGITSPNLEIGRVIKSDSGFYYCVVMNQWNNTVKSDEASVKVLCELFKVL